MIERRSVNTSWSGLVLRGLCRRSLWIPAGCGASDTWYFFSGDDKGEIAFHFVFYKNVVIRDNTEKRVK